MNGPKVLSLVVPVFNEAESLARLIAEIADVAKQLPGTAPEVIFVDDGSTDGSWAEITALAAKYAGVKGIRFRRNFGKAAALAAGFRAATGEVVMTLDADLQDDPHEIPAFLAKLDEGFDLVSGYKQKRHDPFHKVFPSRVFNWLVSAVTGVKLHDHNCGFKAYRAAVAKDVKLYGELHRYVPVLAAAQGYRVGERVVQHRARIFGASKFGFGRYLKGLLDLIQVRYTTAFGWRPMHFFGSIAVAAGFVAAGGFVLSVILAMATNTLFAPLVFLALAAVAALVGSQALFAGFLAEGAAKQRAGEPFSISETTP